jgi:predicted phosphodiesterase
MSSHLPDSSRSPARIAILSDVHGNLPALRAVLGEVRAERVDAIWCLGDLVGYGAQPDECVELARAECDLLLAGNHDLAVAGALEIDDFSPSAAEAVRWTREHARDETLELLAALEPVREDERIGLYHGSPCDPIWEYVLSSDQAEQSFDAMAPRVGAIGHTHVALRFGRSNGGSAVGEQAPAGTELDLSTGEWLVNPGSVGQPRDRDPRAAWLLIDGWTANWRRAEYPVEEAAQAIEAAGLPRHLADRLFIGQ